MKLDTFFSFDNIPPLTRETFLNYDSVAKTKKTIINTLSGLKSAFVEASEAEEFLERSCTERNIL